MQTSDQLEAVARESNGIYRPQAGFTQNPFTASAAALSVYEPADSGVEGAGALHSCVKSHTLTRETETLVLDTGESLGSSYYRE